MIRRGGEAYAEATDNSDVGGVVGATVGFRLGSMLSFYVAAEDYIYGTRIEDAAPGDETGRRTTSRSPSDSASRWGAEGLGWHGSRN